MLLDGYDAHLQLLEDRPKTTAGTYRTHVKAFLRYVAATHASVALSEVTKLQVRAFFLHEANRGITPIARSTGLFALRSFYRFLIAEGSERGESRLLGDPPESGPAAGRVLHRRRGRRHHRVDLFTAGSSLAGRPSAPSDLEIHRSPAQGGGDPAHLGGRS